MEKEKRILFYFIGWSIVALCIFLIGIINADAATYYMSRQYEQQYYNNNGNSVTSVTTTWTESFNSYVSGNIPTTANSYGAGLSISSPIPLIANHTYTLSFYFDETNNIALSSKNKIAIGNDLYGASYNYTHNDYWADTLSSNVNENTVMQFVFTAKGAASHIFIPWTTTTSTTQDYVLTQIVMEDLGSEGVSQNDINNSLNNQTNELNNSINNSTNIITGEINDMQQSIINSNKETQDIIKDQFNSCGNNLIPKSKLSIGSIDLNTGEINDYTSRIRSDLIDVKSGITYIYSVNENYSIEAIVYYDNGYVGVNRLNSSSGTIIFNDTIKQIRLRIRNINTNELTSEDIENVDLYFGSEEICSNRIDETNDKLDNLQGALTDSSAPNTSGLENSAGWLPAGPLDSVLNLPLTMLNSLTNSLGKSCAPLNLTLPYVNKNIQIPCLSAIFAQITGVNGLWTWVGTIASVLILYNYLLNLYAWVDRVLTLRAEFDEALGADLANWGRL